MNKQMEDIPIHTQRQSSSTPSMDTQASDDLIINSSAAINTPCAESHQLRTSMRDFFGAMEEAAALRELARKIELHLKRTAMKHICDEGKKKFLPLFAPRSDISFKYALEETKLMDMVAGIPSGERFAAFLSDLQLVDSGAEFLQLHMDVFAMRKGLLVPQGVFADEDVREAVKAKTNLMNKALLLRCIDRFLD